MSEHVFLTNVGIALVAALIGGFLARLARLPLLVGYLAAGVVLAPSTPGIFARPEAIRLVAHLGVALLMFTVGIQFSLDELRSVWRTALLGGGAQILGTIALGLAAGLALGWGVYGGLFLGCALSLSSTAVMMKVLEERGELGSTHGAVMLGILVVQDFSLIAMIALLPALASFSTEGARALAGVGYALLRAAVFIGLALLLATRAVPALMRRVARADSRELFLVTAVCICLGAAKLADMAGLGLEIGAFIAGILISETDYAHEVFSQVRPLRDVFAALFFVSVGMLVDPAFLARNAAAVLAVVLVVLAGKALLSALAVYLLGWHGRVAILVGAGLAQIGEFSFVLAAAGSARRLIPDAIGNVILSAALLTLLLAPFLYQRAAGLYALLNRIPLLSRWLNRPGRAEAGEATPAPAARALVAGYGRVGRYVSDALREQGIAHLVVDYDTAVMDRLREAGVAALYGDASSPVVLAQARPETLELAVVALPDADAAEIVVRLLKRSAPGLPVVVRVHRAHDIAVMRRAGAEAVVLAEFEAGMEMLRQSLSHLGVAGDAIARSVARAGAGVNPATPAPAAAPPSPPASGR